MPSFQQIDQFASHLKADTRSLPFMPGTKLRAHEKRTKMLFDQFRGSRTVMRGDRWARSSNTPSRTSTLPAGGRGQAEGQRGAACTGPRTAEGRPGRYSRSCSAHGATQGRSRPRPWSPSGDRAGSLPREARHRSAWETDLDEFIIQIDHDHPSHIIRPIIHKNQHEGGEVLEKNSLSAYNDDPEVITRRARASPAHQCTWRPRSRAHGRQFRRRPRAAASSS